MSSTRSEKENIQTIASLAEGSIISKLDDYVALAEQIKVLKESRALINGSLKSLDKQLDLYEINTNAETLNIVKAKLRKDIEEFETSTKANKINDIINDNYKAIKKKNPGNPLFEKVIYNRLISPTSLTEKKSDLPSNKLSDVIENSIVELIKDERKDQLLSKQKLAATQEYYRSTIRQYLGLIIYENLPKELAAQKNFINTFIDTAVKLLYAKDEKSTKFINFIENFSIKIKDKSYSYLSAKEVEKLKRLENILLVDYQSLDEFNKAIIKFRTSIQPGFRSQDHLYELLPDLTKPNEEKQIFSNLKNETSKSAALKDFKAYQTNLNSLTLNAELSTQLDNFEAEIKKRIKNAITGLDSGYVNESLTSLVTDLKNAGVSNKLIENIKVLIPALNWQKEFKEQNHNDFNQKVNAQTDMIGLIEIIENEAKYANDFGNFLEHHINLIGIPGTILKLSNDPEQLTAYKASAGKIISLNVQAKKVDNQIEKLNAQLNTKIDQPLIDILRAQLLQAAKQFFIPAKDPGFWHKIHHDDAKEQKSLMIFIHQIFSPEIKSFSQATNLLTAFLTSNKGFHTNSINTLILEALYNTDTPKGLFAVNKDILDESILKNYPNYHLACERFREAKNPNAMDNKYLADTKLFFEKNYSIKNIKIDGQAAGLVRGKNRLDTDKRQWVLDQAINNLNTMVELIKDLNAGVAAESKAEQKVPSFSKK